MGGSGPGLDGSDQLLSLAGGRTLSYAEYGDPSGVPLLALHGSPDCRLVWKLLDGVAREVGVRLVATDRPGFGHSSVVKGRGVLGAGEDLVELADRLGIATFDVIAISGGLIHGLGAAWAHPERVTSLTSHSGLFLGDPSLTVGMRPVPRRISDLIVRFPRTLSVFGPALFGLHVLLAGRAPGVVTRLLAATRPEGDRAVMRRPAVNALLREAVPLQFRSVATVVEALGHQQLPPYPFRLSEIRQPVEIWQGGKDDIHTPAMARHLARHLPNATLHFFDDLCTFDLEGHYPEMLRRAVAPR